MVSFSDRLRTLLLVFLPIILASTCRLHAETDFEISEEIEFSVGKNGEAYTLSSEHSERYRYLTKKSTGLTYFPVYQPFFSRVSGLSGRYDGRKVSRDQITWEYAEHEDIFISGMKIWWVQFPSPDIGDEIMFEYEVEYDGAEWFPVQYISNMGNLRSYRMEIDHPEEVSVEFSFFFPRDTIPYEVIRPDARTTILEISKIEEQKTLPYFPFNGSNAVVQVRLTAGGRAITPTTPAEFTTWYRGLFDQEPIVDPEHQAKVDPILADLLTPRDKLAAIHDYVRKSIRYIAEEDDYGAIIPRDPNLVMSRAYGDCKDKAFLIAALARRHGIKVDMTLVSTDATPTFDNGTWVGQYNHAICSWDDGTGRIFFDPTSKYTEFGNLPDMDIESHALILDPENPHMVTIPIPERSAGIEIDIRGNVAEPKRSEAIVTLRNGYSAAARYATSELHGVDRENFLSNMVTSHFYKMSLDYFEPDTVGYTFVTYRAVADLSDFLIESPTKRYIPAMPFSIYDAKILDRGDDPWPVLAGLNDPISMRLHLRSDEYIVEPNKISIGDEAHAAIVSSIDIAEDGSAVVSYRLNQASGEYRGDAKQGFLDFCRDYLKSRKEMFVLKKKTEDN